MNVADVIKQVLRDDKGNPHVGRAPRVETPAERHAEAVRLAKVALQESVGMPIVCDWQAAALKVCRAVIEGDGLGQKAEGKAT